MAEYDKEDGRPGSSGPELDALDEDLLSADLEADLDGDFGEDALDEGGLGDSGDPGLDGEFEDSDDDKDDEGEAFGGSGFSGSFGAAGFRGAGGGPGYSFGPSESGDSGDELFDFESPPPPPSVDFGDGAAGPFRALGGGEDSPDDGSDDTGVSFAPSFDDHSERGHGLGRGPERGGSDDAGVEVHSDFVAKADRPSPSDFVRGGRTKTDGKKADDDWPMSGANGDFMSARPSVRLNAYPFWTPCALRG